MFLSPSFAKVLMVNRFSRFLIQFLMGFLTVSVLIPLLLLL